MWNSFGWAQQIFIEHQNIFQELCYVLRNHDQKEIQSPPSRHPQLYKLNMSHTIVMIFVIVHLNSFTWNYLMLTEIFWCKILLLSPFYRQENLDLLNLTCPRSLLAILVSNREKSSTQESASKLVLFLQYQPPRIIPLRFLLLAVMK